LFSASLIFGFGGNRCRTKLTCSGFPTSSYYICPVEILHHPPRPTLQLSNGTALSVSRKASFSRADLVFL
jgi:hypothetical protein